MSLAPINRPQHLVPLAVARDGATAEGWCEALVAAGIDAELRIEDAARVGSASSVFVVPSEPTFATALYVPADRRAEAAAVLIDLGWEGRFVTGGKARASQPAGMLVGAVLAVLCGLAVALALALRNG